MEHCLSLLVSKLIVFSQTFTFVSSVEHEKIFVEKIFSKLFVNMVPLDRDEKNNKTDTFVKH